MLSNKRTTSLNGLLSSYFLPWELYILLYPCFGDSLMATRLWVLLRPLTSFLVLPLVPVLVPTARRQPLLLLDLLSP